MVFQNHPWQTQSSFWAATKPGINPGFFTFDLGISCYQKVTIFLPGEIYLTCATFSYIQINKPLQERSGPLKKNVPVPLKRDPFTAEKAKQNSVKWYCFFLLSCSSGAATQQYIGGKTINVLIYFNHCWYSFSYLRQLSKSWNNFVGTKSQDTGQLIWKPGNECQQLHFRFHGTHPKYPSGPSWAPVEWWEGKASPKRSLWHSVLCAGQQALNSHNNCSTPAPGISLKGCPIVKQHPFPRRSFHLLLLLIKNLFSKQNYCKLSWEKLPVLPRYFVCCLSHVLQKPTHHILLKGLHFFLFTTLEIPHFKLTFRKQPHYKAQHSRSAWSRCLTGPETVWRLNL